MQAMTQKVIAQAYKLFYLEDDHTNSVFEKVFICNYEVLKKIRYELKETIKIFGLIGPVHQIYHHLALYYTQFHLKSQEVNKQVCIEFTNNQNVIDLKEFSKKSKAAVYLLKFQNNDKQSEESIFLALISNDKLYYEKPFDQRSLTYLLLRFIGDLCNDIVILYDKKIWNSLTSTDCPYSAGNNRFFQMNIRQKQRQHIEIKQIKCEKDIPGYEMSKIIDWSHNLFKSQDSFLQYFTKVDQTQLQNRGTQSKKKFIQLVLQKTIENGVFEVQNNTKQTEQFTSAINELKNIHFKTKQCISSLMNQCVKNVEQLSIESGQKSQRIEQLINKNFQQIYYWFMLSQESRPVLRNKNLVVFNNSKILNFIEKKSFDFLKEIYPNQFKKYNQKTSKIIHQNIAQYINESRKSITEDIFKNFLSASQILAKHEENVCFKVQKIQVIKFDFTKQKQNNMVNKLEFKKSAEIKLPLNFLKKYLSSINLDKIKDIKLFKAKFIKEYNIALVTRETEDPNICEYNLLSFDHHEIRSLIKYKDKQLVFHFDETSKKVYLMKTQTKGLTVFNFDDFQKPKNQLNILLDKIESNFEIESYAVSKTPNQRFYFIDSRKDRLYCYDISQGREKRFDEAESKIEKFDYIRAFNNNLYIVLGNSSVINIFEIDTNNYFIPIKQIKCPQNQIIKGVSTHTDEKHQYLVVYHKESFNAFLFQNMNCQNLIRQTEKKIMQGNPILDIFYEAKDRFGYYKTYTLKTNLPEIKQLNLHHVHEIFEDDTEKLKIKDYLKKLILENHKNQYYSLNQMKKLYSSYGLQTNIIHFINEAQSRIPVQICSIENGNIIPLKDGNIINNFDGQEAPIQERCKVLNFGIVQRLLRQDKEKKTIVIAVMGPQSTGKSYLLNRLFGTRFTVASCRTTIGIWMSLIRGQNINFVLLDCQGLFSIHRQLNEQQKLIKILTSISDFTILNLNKSMTSNSLIQLMSNLSKSVSKNTLKSQQLYQGKLFIVVRDVASNEPRGLLDQLYENFQTRIQIQDFLINLFNNGSKQNDRPFFIQLLPTFTQTSSFNEHVQELKKTMIDQSLKKGTKSSEIILEWLKIIINQLACDDSRIPSQVMMNRKLEVIEEKAKMYWEKGSQRYSFNDEIFGMNVTIKDNDIEIEQNRGTENILFDKMHEIFKTKVLSIKPINSVTFSEAYKSLNQYIKRFCNARFEYTKNTLKQQQRSLNQHNQQSVQNELGQIKQKIKHILIKIQKQKQQLSYCLKKCSSEECEQPCIKIKNHSAKIEQKIRNLKSSKSLVSNYILNNSLTESQAGDKNIGIEQLLTNERNEVQNYKRIEQNFMEIQKYKRQKEQLGKSIANLMNQMQLKQKSIKENNKKLQQYKNVVVELENILQSFIDLKKQEKQSSQEGQINLERVKNEKQRLQKEGNCYLDQINEECKRIEQVSEKMKSQMVKINDKIQGLIREYEQQSKIEEDHINLLQKVQIQVFDCTSKTQQNKKQLILNHNQLTSIKRSIQNNENIIKQSQSEEKKLQEQIETENKKLEQTNSKINQIVKKEQIIRIEMKQIQINKSNSLEGDLIPKIMAFHHKRNSQIYNLFKTHLVIEQQIRENMTKFKQTGIIQLEKKIKFQMGKKDNKENKQVMENLRDKLYVIEQSKRLPQILNSEIEKLRQSVDEFLKELFYYFQQPDSQQKRIIQLLCKTKISLKENIDPEVGDEYEIFQGLFYPAAKDITRKILTIFDESQSRVLKELSIQEFVIFLQGNNEIDPSIRKSQNEKEYYVIQQQMGNAEDENLAQSLQQKASFIESLIKLDKSLIKAITYYKNNIIFCFQKYLKVLVKYKKISEQTAQKCLGQVVTKLRHRNKELKIEVEMGKFGKIQGEYSDSVKEIKLGLEQIFREEVQKQWIKDQKIKEQDVFEGYAQIERIITHKSSQIYLKKILAIQKNQCFDQNQRLNKFVSQFLASYSNYLQSGKQNDEGNFVRILLSEYFKCCKTQGKIEKKMQGKREKEKQLKQKYDDIQSQFNKQNQNKKNAQIQIHKMKEQRQNYLKKQEEAQKYVTNQKERQKIICTKIQFLEKQKKNNQEILRNYEKQRDDVKVKLQKKTRTKKQLEQKTKIYVSYYKKIDQFCSKNISVIISQFKKQKMQTKSYQDQLKKLDKLVKDELKILQQEEDQIRKLIKGVQNHQRESIIEMIKQKQARMQGLEQLRKKVILLEANQKKLNEIEKQLETLIKSQETKCSCSTNHKCDMKCEIGCVDKQCLQRGGHEGKHACNSHQCNIKCEIDPKCTFFCQKVLGHVDQTHDCKNTHFCFQTCKHCERQCSNSKFQIHQIHLCSVKKCPKKCILCQKPCASLDHDHDDLAETVTLFKQNNVTNKNQQIRSKLHLCSGEHNCQSLCVHPGICKNSYQNIKKIWNKKEVQIEYEYIEQIQIKNSCNIKIPAGQYKHAQECKCGVNHSCASRCPDCKSLCYRSYKHSSTIPHQTKHRNQQSLIYVSENKVQQIKVTQKNQKNNKEQFIFNVGEESTPFRCDQSCERKGRGHYHLIECPGGDKCYEKSLDKGARHSQKIYQPYRDKKYDMVLCAVYWSIHQFEAPSTKQELKMCNFACMLVDDHKNKQIAYCKNEAWHSNSPDRRNHDFECDKYHKKLLINAVEICFLIDVTGSFNSYIGECVKTIKTVIERSSKDSSMDKTNTKFSVVGYRDHKMTDSNLFKKLKKLCIDKKQQLALETLTEAKALQMSESVFEDTLINLQKKYNSVKNQIDYMEKFEESEKFILKYHYPFYTDVSSSRRLLDEKRRPGTVHYNIMRSDSPTKKKSLKEHLAKELDYFINLIENQNREEALSYDKDKLVQIQDFTTPQKCIQFLTKLKAEGGGDPPEAVLDGMNAAAKLNWSSGDNTSRHILHLFDSPPHGEEFDTNNEDYYPEGCPCKLNLNDIIGKIEKSKINYKIYPFTSRINKTLQIFKKIGLKFEVQKISKLEQFTQIATDFICSQIAQNEVMVKK